MKPSTDRAITVHLPADLAEQLEKLTETTGKNKNAITVAALRDYVAAEVRQIGDIEQGIAEAERNEFASADEVNSFFAKYAR